MKKQIVSMLCGAVALAIAAPVYAATTELTGLLRIQGVMENILNSKDNKDRPNRKWVAQRFRPKVTIKVNDYLSAVYFAEVDTDWGVNPASTPGADGAQSADGVNVETKNIYAIVKVPGDAGITVTAGIQPIADGLQGAFVNDDMAALVGSAKFGNVGVMAGWAKLDEGSNGAFTVNDLSISNDTDVYAAGVSVVPAEGMKFGTELYWHHWQNGVAGKNGYASDMYTLGLTGAAKAGPLDLNGFLVFQNGKWNIDAGKSATPKPFDLGGTDETDISAFGASVDAGMKFNDNFKGDLRVIYFGQDKNATKDQSFNGNSGALFFLYSNMPIFLTNLYKTGAAGGFTDNLAYNEAVNKGYGLLAAVLNTEYNMAPWFVKGTVGYFQAITDKANGEATRSRQGTHLGYEFCLQTGMKVADAATLSFRGSYAILGDFFDNMYYSNKVAAASAGTTNGVDPNNMYTASLIFDLPF